VGRLDFDTLGLLLLSDDGEWTHRLTHPRYELPRTYKATVKGNITPQAMDALTGGMMLEDGPSGPSKTAIVSRSPGRSVVRITIRQGRSRQVRRMFDAVGFPVIQLIRIGFGVLSLGGLKVGAYRLLDEEEVGAMKKLVGLA
jgi:pseudouridine synthase